MGITIALAGNPNTGKTTLFNALTGSNQYVGNWPGVTVEKKEGKLKKHKDVTITDLPGIYSLSPYTLEEVVARNYLLNEKPDAILNIIDGTNLERNLYLTTQLLELGIPTVIVVNMLDILRKNGEIINIKKMAETLSCEVVEISALKNEGLDLAIDKILSLAKSKNYIAPKYNFNENIENSISSVSDILPENITKDLKRFYSIKFLERDKEIQKSLALDNDKVNNIENIAKDLENTLDDDVESIITSARYEFIASIISSLYTKKNKAKLTLSDKIDKIVTNRILALPIFAAIMFMVYYVSISTVGTAMTDWTNDVLFGEIVPTHLGGFLESINVSPWLYGLIMDGIVAGVGAVLGFLPQMLTLFAFLAFLEGCGYMARIAFIMDRIFKKFGLSGKSFIPILIGTGCSVPGIMASRTIENEKDRKMTIITTSFMPCSAKLPVIALIAGAIFPDSWWLAPSAYFVGIATIILSGIALKKTFMFAGDTTPFVIELPAYHMPSLKNVLNSMAERGLSFVKKAGTVVLLSTVAIWFLSSFGFVDGNFTMIDAEELNSSLLGKFGLSFSWIFAPVGFGDWRATVAALNGLVAKENVVSTFGVLYGFGEVSVDGAEIWSTLQASFTQVAAYSFLVFNLLCAPCFAAIGAIKREMNSAKWTIFAVAYQTGLAYAVSLVIYQFGSLIFYNNFNIVGLIFASLILLYILYVIFKPNKVKIK